MGNSIRVVGQDASNDCFQGVSGLLLLLLLLLVVVCVCVRLLCGVVWCESGSVWSGFTHTVIV